MREFLIHVLQLDPEISVIGTARNGEEALEFVKLRKPDIITMDLHMPKMDGFDATRRIMETDPTPIVVVTGSSTVQEVATAFRAIEAGALAVVERPKGVGHPDHEESARKLNQMLKVMAAVKVVRRWRSLKRQASASIPLTSQETELARPDDVKLVAIGASTGGPVALRTILGGLPTDFPVPVLIVQHMAAGFLPGFVEWLSQTSRLPVHVAENGDYAVAGHAYVAPDGFQMQVGPGAAVILTRDDPENGVRPSASCLFRSVARAYGQNAVGVLLTGMGSDGAEELKLMREKGAVTIAQDQETSVVHGMPGEAIKLDAAAYVLPLEKIAGALTNLVKKLKKSAEPP